MRTAWPRWAIITAVVMTALGAAALLAMGRRPWCACASAVPWSWDIWSAHNSQHLLDPYTFTHLLHGALFYAVLWLLCGARWPAARALIALGAEIVWEVAENTDAVIQSYRESTISLNYYGDSVLNSLADVAAFVAGYAAAMTLPVAVTATAFVGTELVLLLTIRDSLVLNVLMLLHPVEAIKAWQMQR